MEGERNYEEEARLQGWKPQEEFEGDESKWVDAETFVKRGEQFVGFLKPRLDKLENKLKEQEQINKDLHAHYQRIQQQRQKEIERLEAELRETRKRAVAEGDGEAFEEAERQLAELQNTKRVQTEESRRQEAPPEWFNTWLSENEWYQKDKRAAAVADSIARELRMSGTPLTNKEFMDKVAELTKQEMPHKFENPNKRKANAVETEGHPSGRGTNQYSGTKFSDLPPEAKKECERLIKAGFIKNTKEGREEYAKIYLEE